MRLRPCLFLSALVLAFCVSGRESFARALSAQDLWSFKRLQPAALAEAGDLAVVPVQSWSIEKNKSTTHLWLFDLARGTKRQLTFVESSDGAPALSKDGKRLAFVSKRNGDDSASLYVMSLDGGEAEKILEMPAGLSSPAWLPDNESLVFATRTLPEVEGGVSREGLEKLAKELKRRKDSKVTAKATEDRVFRGFDFWLTEGYASKLVKLDLQTGELVDLTPNSKRLFTPDGTVSFSVAPDGRSLVLVANSVPPPYSQTPNLDLFLIPTDGSGTMKNLTADNASGDFSPQFSRDGKSLFFGRRLFPSGVGENIKLFRHDLSTGINTRQGIGIDLSFSDWAESEDPRVLWVVAEDRGTVPLFKLELSSGALTRVHDQGTVSGLQVSGSRVLVLHEDNAHPAELYTVRAGRGGLERLSDFNDLALSDISFGKHESHSFKGANGDEIQLWLTYPSDYDPSRKYPLVQLLHGGPQTMCRDGWSYRWNSHVFAAPGYIVAWVNRHGSTGFGEAFTRSIDGEWGAGPFEDIMKATDYLISTIPSIDPDRIAAAGGSYGGYLATWILGHSDRFKCLINHAGVIDFGAQTGCDLIHWFEQSIGAKQWARTEAWERNNPINHSANFRTPMLIIHGEQDYRVPYYQALTLYSTLQSKGVPSRLVVYPNENHWILSPQNSIYWNWEVQSWLARYIGGNPMPKPQF